LLDRVKNVVEELTCFHAKISPGFDARVLRVVNHKSYVSSTRHNSTEVVKYVEKKSTSLFYAASIALQLRSDLLKTSSTICHYWEELVWDRYHVIH